MMRSRRAPLLLVLVVLAAALIGRPVQAQTPRDGLSDAPVPSTLEMSLVRASRGYLAGASGEGWGGLHLVGLDSDNACVSAGKRTPLADGRLAVVSEIECPAPFNGYRFDPVGWQASIKGRFPTRVYREIREKRGGEWRVVSLRESKGYATVDLRWRGVGETMITPSHGASINYALPPYGPVSAWVVFEFRRDAIVTGTMKFRGTGVEIRLPAAAGSMAWYS